MDELVLSLIPLALAAAFQPPQIIALLVLLQTKRGKTNGFAYISGMFLFRLVLGLVFWFLASSIEESVETNGGRFGILVSAVLMMLGLILLVNSLRSAFSAPDEDQAAPFWLDNWEGFSPLRAGLVGMGFLALDPKDWLTDFAAVNLIADADLGGTASLIAYLFYLLMTLSLLLIPLISMFLVPKQAKGVLVALNNWMNKNARSIEILTTIIFGLMFLGIGFRGLGLI